MRIKFPRNNEKYYWTEHAKFKMQFYGLSPQKVLGVIRRPERKEEGIVENTTAVMQPVSPKMMKSKKVWKQEIWVMFQKKRKAKSKNPGTNKKQIYIISAWRYPGVSPKRNPIPEEILQELGDMK